MTELITLKALIKSLVDIADHVPDNALLSINGEVVGDFSISLQNPLKQGYTRSGIAVMAHDGGRREVLDISVNGRRVTALPIRVFTDLGTADDTY